jgi:hypothetical protein
MLYRYEALFTLAKPVSFRMHPSTCTLLVGLQFFNPEKPSLAQLPVSGLTGQIGFDMSRTIDAQETATAQFRIGVRYILTEHLMPKFFVVWLIAGVLSAFDGPRILLASDVCDAKSKAGDICLCKLSELRPTQSSVGMTEVRIRAEKLREDIQNRSEQDFLSHIRKRDRMEPIVVGPGGLFYLTDRHHLARSLYDLGEARTYCKILENLSDLEPAGFWQHMQDNNEVYLKDAQGNAITPYDLPTSIKDLRNDPFRSLAGAVRESCGFSNDKKGSDGYYLEFKWADYLRTHWAGTGIPVDDIDANFDSATRAALQLAIQKEAAILPGYTGKFSCQ